jgi:hypothetical protein
MKMLLTPCKTRDEMHRWIQFHLKFYLPDCTVSRYSDTNPLDIVWEVYRICVLKQNPDNIKELLYVAGRGSGKTLGMAIAELMVLLHDHREVVHVGAIQSQADRCYQYIKRFYYNDKLRDLLMPPKVPDDKRILESPNMSKSMFNLGGDKVTLEILPCTLKACLTIDNCLLMSNGDIKNIPDIKVGDELSSPLGSVKVLDSKTEIKECISIELDKGVIIEGTLDHKVWTHRGWVELQHLTEDDEVICEA